MTAGVVLDMQFYIWIPPTAETVSLFYFRYCSTAEIKQFRRLETKCVLLFYFNCAGTIKDRKRGRLCY